MTKYLEYIGKFSTCLRTQAGRLFGVWGALLHFNIDKSYKKLVKSTYVVFATEFAVSSAEQSTRERLEAIDIVEAKSRQMG